MLSLFNDDLSSDAFSDVFGDGGSDKPQDGIERSNAFVDLSQGESSQVKRAPLHFEPNLLGSIQESSPNNDNLAEKNGFCGLKIDTSRVGYSASIRSPIMIPAGVSPRELLESPVFLPNAIVCYYPCLSQYQFMCNDHLQKIRLSLHDHIQTTAFFSYLLGMIGFELHFAFFSVPYLAAKLSIIVVFGYNYFSSCSVYCLKLL
jgi:WRKY transcription factor 2